MDSFLSMMTDGITITAQAGGLTSKLVEIGIKNFTAKECEIDVDEIRTIPSFTKVREFPYEIEEHRSMQLRKEIVEELRTI